MKYTHLQASSIANLIKQVNDKKGYELVPGMLFTRYGNGVSNFFAVMVKNDD